MKFEVGDRVRVLKDNLQCANVQVGDILTIVNNYGSIVITDNGWQFSDEGFEFLELLPNVTVSVNVPLPMQVKIKKLNENAVVPKYAKPGDAGLDLTATSYEWANGRHVYGTGLAVEIPEGYVGLLFPRSSICKYDLRLTNSVGVIDSGYRGEIKFQFESNGFNFEINDEGVVLDNPLIETKIYKIGDRIGQLLILPYPKVELVEVDELSDSERATGGFGSSGV